MNAKEKRQTVRYLESVIKVVKEGRVEWVAISHRTDKGTTLAMHTAGAPKRPKGLS